jgi:hypothetical protein
MIVFLSGDNTGFARVEGENQFKDSGGGHRSHCFNNRTLSNAE